MYSAKYNNQNNLSNQTGNLTSEEYHKIINLWNDTAKDYPKDKLMHQLFEEQVQKTPDNIAIVCENISLTYNELNKKANQLAHCLRENYNIGPEDLVTLLLDRNEYMIIATLAVLKAGGAYVPIDPNYPDERIKFIIGDTAAKVVLTSKIYEERLVNIRDVKISKSDTQLKILFINCNEFQKSYNDYSIDNLINISNSNNAAYVIYTSGTTGKPKGVVIEHKSICDRLFWHQEYIILTSKDKFIHYFSFGFDGAVISLWWPIISGTQVIIPYDLQDMSNINNLIKSQNIPLLILTPTMLSNMMEHANLFDLHSVSKIALAGEVFSKKLYEKLRSSLKCEIYNFFGPTEASIAASAYNVNSKDNMMSSVPIGKPIANTQIYILDELLHPVPIGVTGEIYIGGIGLARGYLNNPDLTIEKFINNPFQDKVSQNSKLYKTGDLGKWLPDGNIEHLGRSDFQIKIRGNRIEIGEIEFAVSSHKNIGESAIIVHNKDDTNTDDKYLTCYYTIKRFSHNKDASMAQFADEIRKYLQEKLPNYMIPEYFVHLEKMPLDNNGKLNRKALPKPKYSSRNYIAPVNELEKKLCNIWADLLNIPKHEISIVDDFLSLGGNSILAMQLTNRINHHFKSNLKTAEIYICKNIAALSVKIQSKLLKV